MLKPPQWGAGKYAPIPDYAYDCHTTAGRKKGRTKGRTKAQFFRDEQRALKPHQPGLFDELVDDGL